MKTITAAIAGLLLAAAPASAQVLNPTVGAYSAPAATIQTSVTPPQHNPSPATTVNAQVNTPSTPSAAPAASNGHTLPFTGLQVGLVLGAGAMLLGLGLGVRRVARGPQPS